MYIHSDDSRAAVGQRSRIRHVILSDSDFNRNLFGVDLNDGLMKIPQTLNIYTSDEDKALKISMWLFRRERLGQRITDKMDSNTSAYRRKTPALRLIDVTEAEGATEGNGHAYFRKSPWASSDILMTLTFDLNPEERGLVRDTGMPIWNFPEDYIQRLRTTLSKIN